MRRRCSICDVLKGSLESLYEAKRRYSWERASSIINACASSWSHGSMSGKKFWYNQPTLAYLADNGYVWAHNIFCTSSPTLEQPSVFKLMQYLDPILKRASLSMWWREEIKFYTVMYWCLKHETDVSFFSRRIWDPPFSILIGRQCNWHPLMIKRNCCSWCLVKVWRRPAHQTLHPTGYGDEGRQNMRDQSR